MAEQAPICAKIRWAATYNPSTVGQGLTTAYMVNAMRAYFSDNTKPHYWEVDTSIVGGSYDIFTSASPIDTATNKHATLVLKPVAGASGGTEQRIVFITRGNNNPAGSVGYGALMVGYLPDGTFDATNGVLTDNPADIMDVALTHPPTSWSGFRHIAGTTSLFIKLLNEFTVVEYRDDPSKFTDPGQSLLVVANTPTIWDEYTRTGERRFREMLEGIETNWTAGALVGRVLQPFTRYHELAIGNKGDALWTHRPSDVASVSNRPMMEAGFNNTVFTNHSSINRVAPNCWAHAWPCTGFGRTSSFLGNDVYSLNPTDLPEGQPVGMSAGPIINVRDGVRTSIAYDCGTYATIKYIKQFNWDSAGGASKLVFDSSDPTSRRAWMQWPSTIIQAGTQQSRFILWNKDGETMINYYQI